MEFEYLRIKDILDKIYSIEELKDKIYLSGGILPWYISNTDSNRKHGDIDCVSKKENMQVIRDVLKEYGIYDSKLDSLNFGQDEDYGIETYINGIPVGFYPYEITDEGIIQRSFTPELVNGERDLKIRKIPGLDESDYITNTVLEDGRVIGHHSLEILRINKEMAGREKDLLDIQQIDKIGIDEDRMKRVESATKNMYSTIEERKTKAREDDDCER